MWMKSGCSNTVRFSGKRQGLALARGRGFGSEGVVGVWTVASMLALLGAAALALDLGLMTVAAQRAQNVADSAALAAACQLPQVEQARETAPEVVQANNREMTGLQVQHDASDFTYYAPTQSIPDYGQLGASAWGVRVTTHVPVQYGFARVLGVEGGTATRSATAIRAARAGIPICPMWISAQTPLDDRQPQLLHLDDNPSCALIPGSFGFLQPPEGCTAAFFDLLQGYNLTHQDMATACVEAGDTLYAQTGERVGHWDRALDQDQGRGRLERGTTGEWAADIFTDFQKDNPRILLIPMVTYIEGTGSGAVFQIERFAAFWLEGVNQGQKEVWGRFIQYGSPGGDPNYANVNWALVFNIDLVK